MTDTQHTYRRREENPGFKAGNILGSVLAVPIATITAEPRLGLLLGRLGFWRIPDETFPSEDLWALQ